MTQHDHNSKAPAVIVTGASSGIGEAAARACARAGYRVMLAARNEVRLCAIQAEIVREGGQASVCVTDVGQRAPIDRLVRQTVEEFGRIDAMLVNAGLGCPNGVCDIADDVMAEVVTVNLLGAIRCLNAVIPVMKKQGSGHILVVGSVTATLPWPSDAVYAATKAALRKVVVRARSELKGSGIALTEVVPGVIDTPLTKGLNGLPKASAETVADAIVQCLRRPSHTIITPAWYRWLLLANRIAPAAVERWIARKTLGK